MSPTPLSSAKPQTVHQQKQAVHEAKVSMFERLERALIGKFFFFVYEGGTKVRSGRIEAVIADVYFIVRYFNAKDQLEDWRHVARLYDTPSIEDITGFILCESAAELRTCYDGFLKSHLKAQEGKKLADFAKSVQSGASK